MRAVLVGAVEGTEVALAAIAATPGWSLAGVVTLPPELAGWHSDYADLSPAAGATGAAIIHAANSNDPVVLEQVRALDADILLVIGWSQICRPAFLQTARLGAVGYHPAPLPRLRGRAAIPWTILIGDPITAGTLFWIDEGTDTGPILNQRFFHLAPEETAATLYARHMVALRTMLRESLPAIAAGTARRDPQDERFATWAAKRVPEDGRIDWQQPAASIERLIRAVGRPYPGAFTGEGGARIVVWAAECWLEGWRHVASPGQVIARGGDWFAVRCGDGAALRVTNFHGELPRLHAHLGTAGG